MNRRTLLLMFVLWFGASRSFLHAEAKAYELVKYQGKAGGLAIAFDFADGYPEASELKVTEAEGKKPVVFRHDGLGLNHFAPVKGGGTGKSVTLNHFDMDAAAPKKVHGSYQAGGRTVAFTLTKKKQGSGGCQCTWRGSGELHRRSINQPRLKIDPLKNAYSGPHVPRDPATAGMEDLTPSA